MSENVPGKAARIRRSSMALWIPVRISISGADTHERFKLTAPPFQGERFWPALRHEEEVVSSRGGFPRRSVIGLLRLGRRVGLKAKLFPATWAAGSAD